MRPLSRSALSVVEKTAWIAGSLLFLLFIALLLRRNHVAKTDLARFEQVRPPVAATATAVAAPLAEPGVSDFSLWASGRVKAYRESLEVPSAPLLAVLDIPRLELRAAILEGTEEATLDRGLGHIEGTPVPGQPGNVGIAGHRDGLFRCLKDITAGDRLRVTTLKEQREYLVAETQVVNPEDVSVLLPTSQSAVTLVTCFPFYYAGSAPQRFIVRAYEVRKDGAPGALLHSQGPQ